MPGVRTKSSIRVSTSDRWGRRTANTRSAARPAGDFRELAPETALAGDRVTVEMTPYDLSKGRIIYRHKDEKAGVSMAQRRRGFVRR